MRDNYTRKALCCNVVDGDTIDLVIDLGYNITLKERVRLLRVDCKEIKGIDKEEGLIAKKFTEDYLLGRNVYITSHTDDSFGRWLGEIFIEENGEYINFSDLLLKNNMAVAK